MRLDIHPPLLPAAELLHRSRREPGQVEGVDQLVRPCASRRPGHAVEGTLTEQLVAPHVEGEVGHRVDDLLRLLRGLVGESLGEAPCLDDRISAPVGILKV